MDKKKVLDVDDALMLETETKNKVTYDDLMKADTLTETKTKDYFSKTLIIKYIAVTIILFAIIFGSILLFRQI